MFSGYNELSVESLTFQVNESYILNASWQFKTDTESEQRKTRRQQQAQ